MKISDFELQKVQNLLKEYTEKNGSVAEKVTLATNCRGCTGACSGSCKGSCSMKCKGYCSGTCKSQCSSTCKGSCSSGCKGACSGTAKRYH